MNKKIMFLAAAFGAIGSTATAFESINLPQPNVDNGVTLYQALKDRHAVRSFTDEPVDNQMLSNILWVAYGVNREDGRRTIPTAKNEKDLSIYVTDKLGTFLYDAQNNALQMVLPESLLPLFQTQDYMQNVPVVLIYVGSTDDNHFAVMHAGSAYQNAGLYAASVGLNNVVRAWIDYEAVARALKLPNDKKVIVTQAIGWGK